MVAGVAGVVVVAGRDVVVDVVDVVVVVVAGNAPRLDAEPSPHALVSAMTARNTASR
jgi:hypothetical protein